MIKQYAILLLLILAQFAATAQPNFVIVVLDDMGWTGSSHQMDQGLSDSKSDFYFTPKIEAFAKQGMTFSQGYSSAPKCAPTRCGIMTGRSTARNHFTTTDNDIATGQLMIEPNSETAIDGNDITYAEWLKSIGMSYRTAHYGKWHLGSSNASSPENNGFDFSDGGTNNSTGNSGGTVQSDPKKIFDLTTRSEAFIETAVGDGVPFLLQLSHYAVHSDIEARQATIDLYNNPNERPAGSTHTNVEYAAMTEDTDDGISLLLQKIEDLGISDNTYVFLISDNGGQINFSRNDPLTFGKTFIYEGGIRVPFIVRGPGIAADSYNTEPVVTYDLFSTIAELTGSNESLPNDIDGESIVPLLKGTTFSRTEPIYFHSPHYDNNPNKTPRSAVVDGKYKLLVSYETGDIELFDLSSDIGENTDLSGTLTALTSELRTKLRDHLKSVNAPMPTLDPTHANFSGSGTDVDNDGLDDAWELRELLSYAYGPDDDPDNDGEINLVEFNNGTDPFSIDNSNTACDKAAIFANETTHAICFEEVDHVRKIYSNNIPGHDYGPFAGMNDIEGQDFEYAMCLYPELGDAPTELIVDPENADCGNGITFGVSIQGVNFSPFARLYWVNPDTKEENTNWHEEADFILNMDLNGGHVNAVNRYHYHNIPLDYFENDLSIDGSEHSPVVGYAADGFPIYYKYAFSEAKNASSDIGAFDSSYRLKSGDRPGDGLTAPNGAYDGKYIEDYEYVAELSELDECGGRFGVTPEYPNGTYYYVMTDSWPYIPRCLSGKYIDNTFRLGPRCPESTASTDCSEDEIDWDQVDPQPPVTGIEQAPSLEITLYPNPVSTCLKVSSNYLFEKGNSRISIYDARANIVYRSQDLSQDIDVSRVTPGIYFVQVDSRLGQVTERIIVQ
ncbi:MAG: YHYH protein [Cyclobacteriaceae bacterium]